MSIAEISHDIVAAVAKTRQRHLRPQVMKSVVKLFVQLSTPNYSMPWQMKRQQQTFGSGFVIEGRRILTNAHCVAYQKSVRVRKHGDPKKYNAHVLHVAHECDIAMVGVADEKFWEGLTPLEFGDIPQLEEDVIVVGFPTGGDNISVTRGVVSRVDKQRYSHSGGNLLAIQIDAAINSGNSGGPALKDGKVVGIAFETLDNAENIGYIIPIPVIHHFLEDIEKHQRSSGFCNLGVKWQPIESEHMRQYFRLNRDQTGILISKTLKLSCSHGIIQRGDVMMAIDGSRIADDGTVPFRDNERILWDYLLHFKFPGDVIRVTILRIGESIDLEVKLGTLERLVPPQLYDKRPSYVVYCGLVFVALSQPYMQHQYGKDWGRKSPIRLCDRVLYGVQEKREQQVVILSQVLASELTAGYDSFSNLQLYRVNGIPILNLRHLCHVLDKLTIPHIPPETASLNGLQACENCPETQTVDRPSHIEPSSGYGYDTSDIVEETEESIASRLSLGKVRNHVIEKEEMYVSFENIDEIEGTQELRNSQELRNVPDVQPISSPERSVPSSAHTCYECPKVEEEFREFTRETQSFYTDMSNDVLLLDCENYIHFELDKDKVVVLKIADAYRKSDELQQQYAISHARSEDLPPPP